MIGVLGEDKSDATCMKIVIRRLLDNDRIAVRTKGFSGCGDLLKKGARQIELFRKMGCEKFVVTVDSDAPCDRDRRKQAEAVVAEAACKDDAIIVVPVHEIEAWIVADHLAISTAIRQLVVPEVVNPEGLDNPKDWLIRQSRARRSRPLYAGGASNPAICMALNLDRVKRKCPSFLRFAEFVQLNWQAKYGT